MLSGGLGKGLAVQRGDTIRPMSVGQIGRRMLGRHEKRIADLYRETFVDTTALAAAIASFSAGPRILEIGCGDGVVTQALTARLPGAVVLGIDISEHPGKLYAGDLDRASFRSCTAESLVEEGEAPFDLVVVVDVLHHVDDYLLPSLLAAAGALCRPGGQLVVKEWERNASVGYRVGWFSDRVVSGVEVRFFDHEGLVRVVEQHLPTARRVGETRVPPRRSNLLVAWEIESAPVREPL